MDSSSTPGRDEQAEASGGWFFDQYVPAPDADDPTHVPTGDSRDGRAGEGLVTDSSHDESRQDEPTLPRRGGGLRGLRSRGPSVRGERASGTAAAPGVSDADLLPPDPQPLSAGDAEVAEQQTVAEGLVLGAVEEDIDDDLAQEPGATAGADDTAEPADKALTRESSVARASAVMAMGSMVSRVLGVVRSSLLTSVVGVLAAADAFQVANNLPNYVLTLLSAGVLNAVLIPQITKAMKRGAAGQEMIDRLVSVSLALVVGVAVIMTLMAPWLVSVMSNLSGAAYNLAVLLAYVCVPQIAFYGIYAVLGQVLNARNQFAAFMWAPVLANIVQISGLVWFLVMWRQQSDPGRWTHSMVWVLGGSTTLGIAAQALVLIIPLVRGGFRFTLRFRGLRGSGLGSASRMAAWGFASVVIGMIGGLLVTKVLTDITNRPGNAGVVGYAGQQLAFLVFFIPHGFITTSVLTALYPRMSRAANDQDAVGMRRLVRQGLTMPATAVIPASIGLAVLAVPVVRLMFHLLPHQGVVVGEALAIMAIGTLPFGITTLQQRYCFAREDGWLNLWMQLIVTGGQVVFLGIALAAPASQAILWAAAGQTVGNSVAALIWLFIANRQLGSYGLGGVVRLWTRLLVASLVAGLSSGFAAWGMSRLLTTRVDQLVVLAVAGTLFVAEFWLMSRLLRIHEVDEFVNPILRRVPGLRGRQAVA